MTEPTSVPSIICFGDSLTAGYQSPTPDDPVLRETPYGAYLQERLQHRARVHVSGVCGELTGEMVMRIRQDALRHHPDFVVILGGTNDLGAGASPAEIMRNLLKLFELCLSGQIQPVGITVPSIRWEEPAGGLPPHACDWIASHIQRRLALNDLLAQYCLTRKIPCIDLFTATAEPDTRRLAARYSNDGLHLTTAGYRLLAELLYAEVFRPGLEPDSAPQEASGA